MRISRWELDCKYFVNYRWNGLTEEYGCDIIGVSRWRWEMMERGEIEWERRR